MEGETKVTNGIINLNLTTGIIDLTIGIINLTTCISIVGALCIKLGQHYQVVLFSNTCTLMFNYYKLKVSYTLNLQINLLSEHIT